jgi:RNA polymerase sigma-70 factor (ECF subfamily)
MMTNIASLPNRVVPSDVASSRSLAATRQMSDAGLIERIAGRDKLAMQVLFLRHHARVFRFGLRLLHNASLAEDLVSAVFLDVWRKANFEARSEVSTWLLAITRKKAIRMLQRRATEPLDETAVAEIEDPADTPEMATRKTETSSIIHKCLMQLSPAHREIIDLIYYQGKTVEDASTIVGIGVNTVKTRMFYARKHLAGLLGASGVTTAMA